MPNQETGRRRRLLVLHDTLPGGTCYCTGPPHRGKDRPPHRPSTATTRTCNA